MKFYCFKKRGGDKSLGQKLSNAEAGGRGGQRFWVVVTRELTLSTILKGMHNVSTPLCRGVGWIFP